MEAEIRIDTSYYEFLELVQNVSLNSKSIQRSLIRTIYANYDIHKVKNELDKKISQLDNLLIR
ncbi:MAG: hypothetical protein ACFE9T_01775 [Promethearchaeota archaeon]